MTREELHKKILKIQALYLRGATRGEQQAAKAMLDKLTEKYDLHLEDLEKKTRHLFNYNRTAKFIALRIGFHLGFEMWQNSGFSVKVICTDAEFELYKELYTNVNKMYMRKKAEYHNQLQSEMKGYLDATYPSAEPTCPNCESKELSYDSGCVKCCKCGYTKKIRYAADNRDHDSYNKGRKSGAKQITKK